MILNSDFVDPINLGSNELVSINQLVDIVEQIAGLELKRTYNLSAPRDVNGRNSDNGMIQRLFHWEPSTKLQDGMEKTYRWIDDQMVARRAVHTSV
jgi:GDP-D-mannose 3',5'-epimerase